MTTAKHAPPPPGVQPPPLWGTEDHLRELFGDQVSDLNVERASVKMRFRSADHWLEVFRTYFGPIKVAFERVGEGGEEALESDLRDLLERHNVAGDRAQVELSDYLRVVATRA
jgi:hypothetical protein